MYWNEGKQFLINTRINMLYKNFSYFGVVLDSPERGSNDEPSIKNKSLLNPTNTISLNAIKAKIVEEREFNG